MLNVLRSRKFARRVLIVILILIIPAFVLWGAGNITKGPQLIGTIAEQKIYPEDFVSSLQGMRVELMLIYYNDYDTYSRILQDRTVMNELAWQRLIFLNAAKHGRIKISDQDLLSFIGSHPLFQRGGVFNEEAYLHIVKTVLRMEPRQFEELVRDNIRIKSLQNDIYKNAVVGDDEIEKAFHKLNDTIDISYVFIGKDEFEAGPSPGEEEIAEFYETRPALFITPARIEIEYVNLAFNDVETKNKAIDTVNTVYPELARTPDKMREIAEKNALRYEKIGPLTENDLLPGVKFSKNMYDIAFNLEPGALSAPVVTGEETGEIYIIRKISDFPSEKRDLADVREDISGMITEEKKILRAQEKAGEIFEKMREAGASLENAAKEAGYYVSASGGVSFNSYIDNIGPASQFFEEALGTGKGNVMPPVKVAKGSMFLRVDNITAPEPGKFAEQKESLRNQLLVDKRRTLLMDWFTNEAPTTQLKRTLGEL